MCQVTPFGVCAHLGGGEEYTDHVRELDLMQAAGIRGARADFSWGYFEPQKGQWQFEANDKVVAWGNGTSSATAGMTRPPTSTGSGSFTTI